MTRLVRILSVALLLGATLLVSPASASTWAAPAVGGVTDVEFQARVNRIAPYTDGELGPSFVYLSATGPGTLTRVGSLIIPVTAPQGSAFNCLWLRANVPDIGDGRVTAQLWRQPIKFTGTIRMLGEVTTVGTGNQTRAMTLSTPITYLNMSINTYFLELELRYTTGESPKLYDVGLVQGTCPVQ
jgi:hypothetical protein